MTKLIDSEENKIPMWVVCAFTISSDRDTVEHHICGFYLYEEYADLVVDILRKEEYGKGLKYKKVWKEKTECNHMWIWDVSRGL